MKDFKTIAIFTFQSEYTVLQHLLEQANLRYVFQNEMMISVLQFHSNAVGGIRLRVHINDIEKAKIIINSLEDNSHLSVV
ncbi:hypothetical protein ULMA_07480 [Patiriisocius marinus]|uniref:Uncharacterized protein n=1 Tax=Patiriisocius marinus TaxID=1397112 RepID=A0A5J4IXU7_9FLAO|nr:DUF2007 domain-containing protein [Patiriisocius marinus]GER58640.1 hypothetical protein ULMA_07480 [Patiriisocius marinus]